MLEFQEKRKLRSFLYSKTTLAILIIFIVLAANAVWGVYKKQSLTKENLAQTAATFDGLQAREKMLSSEIEKLKTETGKEEEIREKYSETIDYWRYNRVVKTIKQVYLPVEIDAIS